MFLVIDNYDSFVYNLARYFEREGETVRVVRNDALAVEDIRAMDPVGIVISPGPCSPDEAGISLDVIRSLGAEYPVLGVCLGHQAIGQAYGGHTRRSPNPMHGKASMITHDKTGFFKGLPSPLQVARYHSLVCDPEEAKGLRVTARAPDGTVMAIAHETDPVYGVQFHPESILTDHGDVMVRNFIAMAQAHRADKLLKTHRADKLSNAHRAEKMSEPRRAAKHESAAA